MNRLPFEDDMAGAPPRVLWKDMTKPVSLEEHAGEVVPQAPSETVTVQALRRQDLMQQRQRAVDQARKLVRNDDYQFKDQNQNVGGLLRGWLLQGHLAPKCNIFIGDVLAAADIDVRDPKNRKVYLTTDAWGDRRASIPGFQVLDTENPLQPGDIISAGGHVGIYVPGPKGEHMTISAASPDHGDAVVQNDWGFRGNEGPITRWRYVGPGGDAVPPKWPNHIPPYDPLAGYGFYTAIP